MGVAIVTACGAGEEREDKGAMVDAPDQEVEAIEREEERGVMGGAYGPTEEDD